MATDESYSNGGEDRLLLRHLGRVGLSGRVKYLDIGASHPQYTSNTYLFYRMGFRGVLVEPLPWNAEKIREMRPEDVLIEGVVSDDERQLGWLKVKGRTGGGSRLVEDEPAGGRRFLVPAFTPEEVLGRYFRSVPPSFISIDIEGREAAVLNRIDFDLHPVPLLCVETEHGKSQVDQVLEHRYRQLASTMSNTIYGLRKLFG